MSGLACTLSFGCGTSSSSARRTTLVDTIGPSTTGDTIHERRFVPPWNFMSLDAAEVDLFLQEHPTFDGRGVVILIFDTGIDVATPGLDTTTTGQRKVIGTYDFARSNVVVCASRTVRSGRIDASVRITGLDSLRPARVGVEVYVGQVDERTYRNSSVRDFDGDGESTSRFPIVLYRSHSGWRVAIDTDRDGDVSDEVGLGNFDHTGERFGFVQTDSSALPMAFTVQIDTVAKSVAFHYDMDSHGTHVAGIAAGFGIQQQAGFNGVAPGAQIISCKISGDTTDDNSVTGSMRRAYDFAARLADSLAASHVPVVVNMSFGIGSALEGRASIENYLDTLIPCHPNLYVVTSAGNEGPGVSTVGIPAAASRIISVGAVLPRGIGRDGYNAVIDRDILWDFSSRGGEVDKPDVVAPGTAVSTIPRFAYQARLSGTSMASPYTTGVVALLLSGLRQLDSTWTPTQELIRRALRAGARPLPDYAAIEQGGGILNVRNSFRILRDYRARGFADQLELYTVSTTSPNYPDESGSAAFWRSGFVPGADWRQAFSVSRYLPSRRGRKADDFFRAYTLESTAEWLTPLQKTVYIRDRSPAEIHVLYDTTKLKEPGLYSARVVARRATAAGPTPSSEVEFELLNTVIIPYRFNASDGHRIRTPWDSLPAGVSRRYFLALPIGASAIRFTLRVPEGTGSNVSGKIAAHRGETVAYLARAVGRERPDASVLVPTGTLGDGIVEVVVQAEAFEGAGGLSPYYLEAQAIMLDATIEFEERYGSTWLAIDSRNTGNNALEGTFSYTVKGFGRVLRDTMTGDYWSHPMTILPDDGALWVEVVMPDEDYMRSTDVLVRLVDDKGSVQAQESLNGPSVWLFLPNFTRGDTSHYYLTVNFGAAHDSGFAPIHLTVTENHVRPSDAQVIGGYGHTTMYPYVPYRVEARMPSSATPNGFRTLVDVNYKLRDVDQPITWEVVQGD